MIIHTSRLLRHILVFIILFGLAPHLSLASTDLSNIVLRVAILKNVNSFNLTIRGYYTFFTLNTHEIIEDGKDLKDGFVFPTSSGFSISGKPYMIYGIKIVPKRDGLIYINKHSFRGEIDIIRTEKKELLVVNHIGLEDYLKGVLYHEVSHWWPIEALKAQAIAARTYALYQRTVNSKNDYDLTNDIYSQVYGGKASERFRTNRAVDLTHGKVLTFRGKVFPSYYHATCGGHTEDASNVWDIELPPLRGRKCDFCKFSPHYRWKYKISVSELERKLNQAGYNIHNLKDIILQGRTPSGRIKKLKLIFDKSVVIDANRFRLIVGPDSVRSTNFELKFHPSSHLYNRKKNIYIIFYGRGWGHGVGMCQWGAFFLALRGYRAEQILRYYYPGSVISQL